jgi:hypothetical protein
MTTDTLHPLAAEYLKRLCRAGRGLPPGRLRELLAEIEGHLSEAIDPTASDAEALTVLDKLGESDAIIAAETPDPDEVPARRGTSEWAAIILLLARSCRGGSRFAVSFRRRRRERSARALCVNSSGAGRPPPAPRRSRRHRHDAS